MATDHDFLIDLRTRIDAQLAPPPPPVVIPPPSIASLAQTSGPVGTSVTIAGANFGATQAGSTVTFNGIPAGTAVTWTDAGLAVVVPNGATTGNVLVIVGGVASNGVPFTVLPPHAPMLCWTYARQAIWDRMKAENHVWYTMLLAQATAGSATYGNLGLWGALAYHMSGDPAYAAMAYTRLQAAFASATATSLDSVREYATERVLVAQWIWDTLTPAEQTTVLGQLDNMFTVELSRPSMPAATPERTNDSDQVVGAYFGLAWYHLAFGAIHPQATTFFQHVQVGGLTSTGNDRLTLRNCITNYISMAAGGEWIEGTEYNLGTMGLLLRGVDGVRTMTGLDYFPEVTAWRADCAKGLAHRLTPNRTQSLQWGDNQEPHILRVWAQVTAAMNVDDPIARQLVADLVTQYGALGSSVQPVARGFLLYDPYGSTTPINTLPLVYDAPGQGILSSRTSWADPLASQFMSHVPPIAPAGRVDHFVGSFADLQLYRKAGWALTHPQAYQGHVVVTGDGCNVMLQCGYGCPSEFYGARVVQSAADYTYVAGTAGGNILGNKSYYPPETFWYEWSRATLFIPGGPTDTIIVFDRTHVIDPTILPHWSQTSGRGYSTAQMAKILAAPFRRWYWHAPTEPQISGTHADWPIGSGETARVTWNRTDIAAATVNEAVAWTTDSTAVSERKWHLHLTPSPDSAGFQALITVLEFGPQMATITPLDLGDVQGVQVDRPGEAPLVALFNAIPGPALADPAYIDGRVSGTYQASVPAVLQTVRLRTTPVSYTPPSGSRVWYPETATGVVVA
jgi:IPT/TIG domain